MATPFIAKAFTFTQPDGSKLEVKGWGNQYYARFETLDGYTVTKNPATGFWEVAQLSVDGASFEPVEGARSAADGGRSEVEKSLTLDPQHARAAARDGTQRFGGRRWEQRRNERRSLTRAIRSLATSTGQTFSPPQQTTIGNYFGLCLLIDFVDAPATIPQSEVENFCNQPGYAGFGNSGSVFDYFLDQSIGRCRYKNIVTQYYRARFPKTYYTDPNISIGTRARELIREALQHWLARGFDFSRLTADDASLVYATNVFYAGDVVNNWNEGLWPHSWQLGSPVPLVPGKFAMDYQVSALGSELELGTFCHENGHMLCDYPDLYDYGGESAGVGDFCLMCTGCLVDQKNPTNISGYLKRQSGWANKVIELDHDRKTLMVAGQNTFAICSKNESEYFLIENRVKRGRDAALPDGGLAIWHVDELGDNSNEQMTPDSHYELSLEQADGLFELEHANADGGDDDDLFGCRGRFSDTTTPNSQWWDGTPSHLTIDNIMIGRRKSLFHSSFSDKRKRGEVAVDQSGADGE